MRQEPNTHAKEQGRHQCRQCCSGNTKFNRQKIRVGEEGASRNSDDARRKTIEPTEAAQDAWTAHVAEVSSKILRLKVKNYMVHVNEDGSRVFMPYVGGMNRYVEQSRAIVSKGYEGFSLQ